MPRIVNQTKEDPVPGVDVWLPAPENAVLIFDQASPLRLPTEEHQGVVVSRVVLASKECMRSESTTRKILQSGHYVVVSTLDKIKTKCHKDELLVIGGMDSVTGVQYPSGEYLLCIDAKLQDRSAYMMHNVTQYVEVKNITHVRSCGAKDAHVKLDGFVSRFNFAFNDLNFKTGSDVRKHMGLPYAAALKACVDGAKARADSDVASNVQGQPQLMKLAKTKMLSVLNARVCFCAVQL